MAALSLRIETADGTWDAHWSVNGQPVGGAIRLEAGKVQALREASRRFLGLFERDRSRPFDDPESLRSHGRSLAEAWLTPALAHLEPSLETPNPEAWVIQADDPAVLDLPWELVEFTPGLPVGCDPGWSIYRASLKAEAGDLPPRPGPLRVLFLASAPVGPGQLDYEREEDLMLRASSDVKGEIITHFAETGGLDELAELIVECRPHVVHLSGHGNVDADGRGAFAFEDERGRPDVRTVDEIARAFRGRDVRLAFVNGCKTSEAAVAGICRGLVAAGVPAALGWAASVADDRATEFAAAFYRRLVRDDSAPVAAAHARDAIRRSGLKVHGTQPLQDATFALPRLYGIGAEAPLIDPARRETYDGPRTV